MSAASVSYEAARLALAQGDSTAMLAWAKSTSASDADRFEAALLLAEHGHLEGARSAGERIGDGALAAELAALLAGEPGDALDGDDDDDGWKELEPRHATRSEQLEELFLRWFGGRRDLYASQWHDERRQRGGYRPVERPLTSTVARAHLDGRSTVGQYVLFPDGTVSFGVIDLDLDAGVHATWRATRGDAPSPAEHPAVRAYALALLRAGRQLGVPLFGEDSGGKGIHLWAFFQPRTSARNARELLGAIVRAAGPQPPELGVELFPKQETPGPRGLSSLVKLPLGIHQKTGRRCPLLDDDLRAIDSPDAALCRLTPVPPEALGAILGRRLVLLPSPELDRREPVPPAERPVATTAVLAECLRAIPEDEEPTRAERVLTMCDALRVLVHRAHEERKLEPSEARAIAYTLGLLGRVPRTAREAFAQAQVSSKELDRLQHGLPPPMGCAKLRAIAKMAACRGCLPKAMPYATPVLHALGSGALPEQRRPAYLDVLDGHLAEDPMETIGASLRRIEEKVDTLVAPRRSADEPDPVEP